MPDGMDLNADLGESFGAWRLGDDEALVEHITSANLACGFHAGDFRVMEATVALCRRAGVAVGAQPGYPDLLGFGRRPMPFEPDDVESLVRYQVGALEAFCRAQGVEMQHVKPHGALYNMATADEALSEAMARAVKDLGGDVILYALSNSRMLEVAKKVGVRVAGEAFADRGYSDDGTLAPRGRPGGMIEDEDKAVAQALGMLEQGSVTSLSGRRLPVAPDTLCLHGDQPDAVAFAKALRRAFAGRGIAVGAP